MLYAGLMQRNGEHDDGIREATRYLRENAALRQAVGAAPDAVLSPRYLGVGEHNLNYRFTEPASGRAYVLRVNVASQPFHDNQVAYEFAALRALEPSGCTPRPVYLDDSPNALGKGVLVETFCEGRELDFDHLSPGDLGGAMQLMAEVHAVPVGSDCPLYRPADPARELYEECLARFRVYRASAFEEARLTAWVERFIARTDALLSATACPAADCSHIINTEPLPSHFLLPPSADGLEDAGASAARPAASGATRPEDGGAARPAAGDGARPAAGDGAHHATGGDAHPAIGGGARPVAGGAARSATHPAAGDEARSALRPAGAFIDWERPLVGEVAQDVAYFVAPTTTFWDSDWRCPPDTAAELVEAYWRAVDGRFNRGAFNERFPLYRALTALRSTTWCCRALVQYSKEGAHKTPKTASKLPAYLSDDFLAQLADECFS